VLGVRIPPGALIATASVRTTEEKSSPCLLARFRMPASQAGDAGSQPAGDTARVQIPPGSHHGLVPGHCPGEPRPAVPLVTRPYRLSVKIAAFQVAERSSTLRGAARHRLDWCLSTRGGAVRKRAGLIIRRSQVQILPPLPLRCLARGSSPGQAPADPVSVNG